MPFLPNVPRCQHLKVNGTQCGSPALKRNRLCFFHQRFQEERIKLNSDRARRGRATFILPVLEDANSIQVSLMQIMRLLVSGQIDAKIAGLLLYALQTATLNLRRVTFEPSHVTDVVIDRNTIDQTCIGGDQWCEEDFEDPEEDAEEDEDEEIEAEKNKDEKPPVVAAKAQPTVESEVKPPMKSDPTPPAALPAPATPATTAKAPMVPAPHVKAPISQALVIEGTLVPRPLPEITINPMATRERSLSEPRRPPTSLEVSKKKPPKNADPATTRKQVQDIVHDWIMKTVKESADGRNAGS